MLRVILLGSLNQSAAQHPGRTSLYIAIPSDIVKSREFQNSNVIDRPAASPHYLEPSSRRSVTQVLRLAVNFDVVDAAIEALGRVIRAGSQA